MKTIFHIPVNISSHSKVAYFGHTSSSGVGQKAISGRNIPSRKMFQYGLTHFFFVLSYYILLMFPNNMCS